MSQAYLILKKFFVSKQKVNPKYSLRSLARDLALNPSFVSRILSGKQAITPERLEQFIDVLSVDALSAKELKLQMVGAYIQELGLNHEELLRGTQVTTMDYEDRHLTSKEMNVLSPWYNVAIMELTSCVGFVYDSEKIAKRLGLRPDQVDKSVSYLVVNGYLQEIEGGFQKTSKRIRLPTMKSHDVVRFYHKAMMELAVKEMFQKNDDVSFEERLITSTSIAVNSKNLPRAKERLAELQLEIAEILHSGPCDEVYDLTLALFPLSKG